MSRPDPVVAFACFDVRAACESLDPATVQKALYENGDVIVSLAGPGASHLDQAKRRLLNGDDLYDLDLPESVKKHIRSGLTLSLSGCGGTPAQHVTAALLGQPIDAETWPELTQELSRRKGKLPATWPSGLTPGVSGLATGNSDLASLSPDAKDILALTGAVKKEITGEPEKFWVPTSLDLHERLFPAVYELEAIGLARGSDPPDRLNMLTVKQLHEAFPYTTETTKKPDVIATVLEIEQETSLLPKLAPWPAAASQTLLTVGLAAGKEADWLLAFSELLAEHLVALANRHKIREQARLSGGTPGGWHLIRKGRCTICKAAQDPLAEHDSLPPFHIGCTCRVFPDGPHGMTADQIAKARRAPVPSTPTPNRFRAKAPKTPPTPRPTPSPASTSTPAQLPHQVSRRASRAVGRRVGRSARAPARVWLPGSPKRSQKVGIVSSSASGSRLPIASPPSQSFRSAPLRVQCWQCSIFNWFRFLGEDTWQRQVLRRRRRRHSRQRRAIACSTRTISRT